jgi:hypothetical protein
MILIDNNEVNIFNLKSHGKCQHQQLNYRNYKNNRQHGFVSENLPEFFLKDVEDGFQRIEEIDGIDEIDVSGLQSFRVSEFEGFDV